MNSSVSRSSEKIWEPDRDHRRMWSQRKQRPEDHRQNGNQTITQHMQRLGSRCDWNGRESIIPGIR